MEGMCPLEGVEIELYKARHPPRIRFVPKRFKVISKYKCVIIISLILLDQTQDTDRVEFLMTHLKGKYR